MPSALLPWLHGGQRRRGSRVRCNGATAVLARGDAAADHCRGMLSQLLQLLHPLTPRSLTLRSPSPAAPFGKPASSICPCSL